MTQLIPAIYEHGEFIPIKPLNLPDHLRVLIAVAIRDDEIPSMLISKLAEQSNSFRFLDNPEEDIYSPTDGKKV